MVAANTAICPSAAQTNPANAGGPALVVYSFGAYYEGEFYIGPMSGWTSGHRIDVNLYWGSDIAVAGTTIAWQLALGCFHPPDSIYTGRFNATYQTLTVTPSGTQYATAMSTLTGLTVPAACVASDVFLLRVGRNAGANGDTTVSGQTAYLIGEQVLWN
jgi:hypothetical protein